MNKKNIEKEKILIRTVVPKIKRENKKGVKI